MLWSTLEEAAQQGKGRIGSVARPCKLDYLSLSKLSREVSRALLALGVKPRMRLGCVTDDPTEFIAFFFAAASLDAVVTLGTDRFEQTGSAGPTTRRCATDMVLLPPGATAATRLRARRIGLPLVPLELGDPRTMPGPHRARGPHTGQIVTEATSAGTARRSQENLVHEAAALVHTLGLTPEDRILCGLPLGRSPGLSVGLLAGVRAKANLMFCPADDPAVLDESGSVFQPTVLISDCATLACKGPTEFQSECWEQLKLVLVPHCDVYEQIARVRAAVPRKLVTFYHCPETGVIALGRGNGSLDCVGQPLQGLSISVMDDWTGRSYHRASVWSFGSFVCLRHSPGVLERRRSEVSEPGIPGRITVTGPTIGRSAMRNGRFYSGDWGYLDAEGQLHVLPRYTTTRRSA